MAWATVTMTGDIDGIYFGPQKIATFSTQAKSDRQGGATVWDLSAVKRLYSFDEAGDLKLKVAAKNIFDKSYDTGDALMPGSSVYVGLIYELR